MKPIEALRALKNKLLETYAISPSPEWDSYEQALFDGNVEEIPTYGRRDIVVDYYGYKEKRTLETGRVHVPQGTTLESSYFVTHNVRDNSFDVVREGIFPRCE